MEISRKPTVERYAVVTGANKGIGLEIARQLAHHEGITVILTARDKKSGMEATESLIKTNIVLHQLDVRDPASVKSLAEFLQTQFGRLDILVNNAAAGGVIVDFKALKALNVDLADWNSGKETYLREGVIQRWNYKKAVECLDTNYYGCIRVTQLLIPLLKLSTSGARIVNVSSIAGELKRIPCEQMQNKLGDINNLTEEKLDEILQAFLHDLKQDKFEASVWSSIFSPIYSVSKAAINAYTRFLAKRYPEMCINCVHPGYVKTDLTWHIGTMTAEEGAKGPVILALLPNEGPSGCYFNQMEMAKF
ncbi:short-chain dehydrogenase/reductase 2b-like [Macadamia integrifolia]|uniref:short-chain dehydrogenase/reductase 2b-like n=1 Tax=Macadamia integrifolia TaxID=60698 RepID=UPI001C4F376B|nr:short-chain dehydrogenase/reductase 2b-like [Macadamia integrifolia]